MSDYQPIPCALYDRYEIAIMHGERLRVTWHDADGVVHVDTVSPFDLQTCAGAEYLLAHSLTGAQLRLRLDRIVDAQAPA